MIDVWELMRWLMEDVEVMGVLMKVRVGLGKLLTLTGLFWLRAQSSMRGRLRNLLSLVPPSAAASAARSRG